jgi:hypothetical protein
MRILAPTDRPNPWHIERKQTLRRWTLIFVAVDWCFEWFVYYLSRWKFLEMLEYISSLGVLVAVVFYFSESGDRIKQKHYQAWQVINTAQGKGGSGGRMEALQELSAGHVPLVGVDVSGAFLRGINLAGSDLLRSNFSGADARNSDFRDANFSAADLRSANFRDSIFYRASFLGTQLDDVDFSGADLSGADLSGASMPNADLRNSNLSNIKWREIANLKRANISGIKTPPEGFTAWALQNGAIQSESEPH